MVAATHVPLALHAPGSVSTPPVQDMTPVPHGVPAGRLVVSMQVIVPVMHEVVPFLHVLLGWQTVPAVHDTQVPALHTRFVPQLYPLG
jgi:hypothetical protein